METKQENAKESGGNNISQILASQSSLLEGNKACLFNLIVYTHEPRRTNYFKEVIKLIKSQFPCRIIFIQGDPASKESYLRVQASIEKSQEEKGIVCDQIFIEAAGQDINRVYFLLYPLFVPDLPVYLFWGQDPITEHTILPHLEHFATRIIFDSEATENLQQFSRAMLNRLNSTTTQIIDMNWARIAGWREALGQIFDSQERFEQLASSHIIQIHYNNRSSELFLHPQTQAIYLQAWLASCLGWNFYKAEKDNENQIIQYQNEKMSHEILLKPDLNPNFEPEEILELHIKGLDYEGHFKRITQNEIEIQTSNRFQCILPFILYTVNLSSGRSFMQEIFYQKPGDKYTAMLQLISLVNWS